MDALVIAEHDNSVLAEATLSAITAGKMVCDGINVLVAGYNCEQVAKTVSAVSGVTRVYHAEAEHYAHGLAEELSPLIVSLAEDVNYILAPASTFGKNLLPRVAAFLDVGQISDVVRIESNDTFIRPIYAGNALSVVRSSDRIKILTIRATAFEATSGTDGDAPVKEMQPLEPANLSEFIRLEKSGSDRADLSTARIVVSGGRGLASADNFKLIEELANYLGAAVGATRAAVDAGYVPNDYQVGQTGKIIAPDLYIAIGISGAIQHLAGIKDSKCIVAINKDEDAPIFDIADYGLVIDLFDALPELKESLKTIN